MHARDTSEPRPDQVAADANAAEAETATAEASHQHDDELADEWGDESFPSSDPPANY